jgi:hypothetical protein
MNELSTKNHRRNNEECFHCTIIEDMMKNVHCCHSLVHLIFLCRWVPATGVHPLPRPWLHSLLAAQSLQLRHCPARCGRLLLPGQRQPTRQLYARPRPVLCLRLPTLHTPVTADTAMPRPLSKWVGWCCETCEMRAPLPVGTSQKCPYFRGVPIAECELLLE